MLFTVGDTEIIPSVIGEPFDLFPQIAVAQIALGTGNLMILHGLRLICKFPGDIFGIAGKLVMNFFFSAFRQMVGIIGYILKHCRSMQTGKDLCGIVGIAESPVKGNVLLDMQKVDGIFQTPAAFSILQSQTEQFLGIIKGKRTVCQWLHFVVIHISL